MEQINFLDSETEKAMKVLQEKVAGLSEKYKILEDSFWHFSLDIPHTADRPCIYINVATLSCTTKPDIFKIIKDSGFEIYSVRSNSTYRIVIGTYKEIDIDENKEEGVE